jgi:hypothetical protein
VAKGTKVNERLTAILPKGEREGKQNCCCHPLHVVQRWHTGWDHEIGEEHAVKVAADKLPTDQQKVCLFLVSPSEEDQQEDERPKRCEKYTFSPLI